MNLSSFFRLIRYKNLLMIAFTQILVKYFLFEPFQIATTLTNFQFFLLVLSMVSLAAAGNIINDIFDIKTDTINKPEKVIVGEKISENAAYNWFFGLNILGVGIGFYLSNLVGQPSFTVLFILPSALLYLYATHLKKMILVGNLVVSIMVGMIIVMVGIFDLFPAITPQNRDTQRVIFSILLDYGIFAFLVNLLREMVKDQQDIKGDFNAKRQTLPVVLGRERTNKFIFLTTLLPILGTLYYIYQYLFENRMAVVYVLFFIVAPLLVFLIKVIGAKSKKQYHRLSILLKLVLVFGLSSIGLYQFILL
ncbi:MAG TPA: geranylgeranylglycerol-phosphate geranylgeranyltransferase [Salinimicrobium sp.]|nr:geranylgeranylglycerol-phosphate geranylgeranyltransferase [Salinimicrobium sp.]